MGTAISDPYLWSSKLLSHKQLLPSSTCMGNVMWLNLLFKTALLLNA